MASETSGSFDYYSYFGIVWDLELSRYKDLEIHDILFLEEGLSARCLSVWCLCYVESLCSFLLFSCVNVDKLPIFLIEECNIIHFEFDIMKWTNKLSWKHKYEGQIIATSRKQSEVVTGVAMF